MVRFSFRTNWQGALLGRNYDMFVPITSPQPSILMSRSPNVNVYLKKLILVYDFKKCDLKSRF
jgi:hypothetical protein